MASQPRQRPAATDYFNPTEQIELLQSIKAKIERSAASTPQDSHFPLTNIATSPSAAQQGPSEPKPVDFKAHEQSLREKLEKAKADREARAKAEAVLRTASQPLAQDSLQQETNENKSIESTTTGPPPPPILNNTTAVPPVPYAWNSTLGYPPPVSNYPRPPYQYPPPYPPPYGMPPYANGHTSQPYGQWNQFAPLQSTPGIPPPPPQPNQGPPNRTSTPIVPQNQSSSNPTIATHAPATQGTLAPSDTRFRSGIAPPSAPPPSALPQPPETQQPGIPARPTIPAPFQKQPLPRQPPTTTVSDINQPPTPPPAANDVIQTAPAPRPVSQISSVEKGSAGSTHNSTPSVPPGPTTVPQTMLDNVLNGSKPPQNSSLALSELESRGRPPSNLQEPRHYDDSRSLNFRRDPLPPGPNNPGRGYPPSPKAQHSRYQTEPVDQYPPQEPPSRASMATRITDPPSRASYRGRSRSPQRTFFQDHRPQRPVIPDEGYKRENWDTTRGGYKISTPPPRRQSIPEERRYSPPPPRRSSPPRYPPQPRREVEEAYYQRYNTNTASPPPGSYQDYRRQPPPPPGLPTRSRSPPYRSGYISPPPPPSSSSRSYPPLSRGREYYDYPSPRDPYAPRDLTYTRSSPPPPPLTYRDRGEYDDYHAQLGQLAPPVDYMEREYERGYSRAPPPSVPPSSDLYGSAGYRDFRDTRGSEAFRPPPREYSPLPPPVSTRGRSRGRGRY